MAKCKNCGLKFQPRFSTLEKYCWDAECKTIEALAHLEKKKKADQKDWNKRKAETKQKLKTLKDYKADLKTVFHEFIRLRDRGKTCISCHVILRPGLKYDAGHFFPAGTYKNMEFEPMNVHGQCTQCNQQKHANLHEYRIGLIKRYGLRELERLEAMKHGSNKFTIPEIIELIAMYKSILKEMKKNISI